MSDRYRQNLCNYLHYETSFLSACDNSSYLNGSETRGKRLRRKADSSHDGLLLRGIF
jgi:hypothetical protein